MAVVFGPKRSFTGNLYVGGDFDTYNLSGFQYFTKLNSSDASLFSGSPYNSGSFDNFIFSFSKYTSRRILIGGDFTTYNGIDSYKLVSIDFDGNIDNIFRVNTNIDAGTVFAIGIDDEDKVIIGGKGLSGYGGGTYSVGNIMRLNLDGSFDTTFSNGYAGFDFDVNTIAVQKDGKILAGGAFTTYTDASGAHSVNYICRLNNDGTYDSTFSGSCNNFVRSIVIDEYNDTIIVGGDFTSPGNYIVRFNNDGTVNSTFGVGFNGKVYTLKLDSERRIIAGGDFTNFQAQQRIRLTRIFPNNNLDFDFFTKYGFDGTVVSVDVDSDNSVFVGGKFTSYTYDPSFPISSPGLIKLKPDTALNIAAFNVGSGYTKTVYSVLFSNQ